MSQQVAASVFGCGADPADCAEFSYIQKWNTTSNALEATAVPANKIKRLKSTGVDTM